MTECTRHRLPYGCENASLPLHPFYVVRCAHFRGRFVVEVANLFNDSHTIDYVQEDPFIVETYCASTPEVIEALWLLRNDELLAGSTPSHRTFVVR